MQKYRLSKNVHGQANGGGNGSNKTGKEQNDYIILFVVLIYELS